MKKKIMFVGNTGKSIYNFRGGVINALLKNGFDIIIAAPKDDSYEKFINMGCKFKDVKIDRKGNNPVKDLLLLINFFKIYRSERPKIIFHYTIKPNIYGSIAAKLARIKSIAVTTGLGYVFINNNMVSKIAKLLYKIAFNFSEKVWFLNKDDMDEFIKGKIIKLDKTFHLKSEGINTEIFLPIKKEIQEKLVFLLIARLLHDKGIGEYVEAAKILLKKYKMVEFQILGPFDSNPTAIKKCEIEEWQNSGIIKYLGETNDVRKYISKADCIVLPSYREGVPRTLMEAASMEKPIIATDVPGCREVVDDGYNGYLCEVKNGEKLAEVMEKMILLEEREREKLGKNGREKMVKEFDEKLIIAEYLKVLELEFGK